MPFFKDILDNMNTLFLFQSIRYENLFYVLKLVYTVIYQLVSF